MKGWGYVKLPSNQIQRSAAKNEGFVDLWFGNTLFDAVQRFAVVAFTTQSDPHRPRVQGLRRDLRESVKSFLWSRNTRKFKMVATGFKRGL